MPVLEEEDGKRLVAVLPLAVLVLLLALLLVSTLHVPIVNVPDSESMSVEVVVGAERVVQAVLPAPEQVGV